MPNDKNTNTRVQMATSNAFYLDLEGFAAELYLDENQVKAGNIEIEEMSLQGVYPLEKKEKVWRTRDDGALS